MPHNYSEWKKISKVILQETFTNISRRLFRKSIRVKKKSKMRALPREENFISWNRSYWVPKKQGFYADFKKKIVIFSEASFFKLTDFANNAIRCRRCRNLQTVVFFTEEKSGAHRGLAVHPRCSRPKFSAFLLGTRPLAGSLNFQNTCHNLVQA
jgi:hypothetical protein